MNIRLQGSQMTFLNPGLKSTEQKLERQAKRDGQIAFFEKQKENLKKVDCSSVEEIARKLEQLHSYEDQIASVKSAYNNEQMWHVMDEAMERAEKIAEEVEKMEPKTPEERKKEALEELLGNDEENSVLEESMEEILDIEELTAQKTMEILEEGAKEAADDVKELELLEDLDEQKYRKIDFYA